MQKRILVADDDKEIRDIVSFILKRHGFVVDAVSSGQQLQRHLAIQLPDLIILDVMMPGEDGYQICSNLRKNPQTRHIPVMIITAHAEDIYQRISVDLGAVQHMTKPFHPLELADCVRSILEV
ncbi:MAG TPA: response regulator [Dictyobacter sp.]|jgi:CheY-like chemotaxis protein|nr:response regulator [Dictyobacter sp.]